MQLENLLTSRLHSFPQKWTSIEQLIPNIDIVGQRKKIEQCEVAKRDKVESFLRSLQEGLAYVAWDKIVVQDHDSKRPEKNMPIISFPVVCFCERVLEDIGDLQPLNANDKADLEFYLLSVGFRKTSMDEMGYVPKRLFRFYELDFDYRNPAILLEQYKGFCIKNNIPTSM